MRNTLTIDQSHQRVRILFTAHMLERGEVEDVVVAFAFFEEFLAKDSNSGPRPIEAVRVKLAIDVAQRRSHIAHHFGKNCSPEVSMTCKAFGLRAKISRTTALPIEQLPRRPGNARIVSLGELCLCSTKILHRRGSSRPI